MYHHLLLSLATSLQVSHYPLKAILLYVLLLFLYVWAAVAYAPGGNRAEVILILKLQ